MPPRRRPTLTLCAFRAAGVAAEAPLPTRLVVCPWGSHDVGSRGKAIVNERTVRAFAAVQDVLGRDGKVAGDFDHNTVEGTPAYAAESEPRKVAGWGTAKIEPGVGIVVEGFSYTATGQDALEGGHFQDISPAVVRDDDGTVLGLHSFAFCRHGQIKDFTISLAAAKGAVATALTALTALTDDSTPMKTTPELLALLAALGTPLAEDADESAVASALAAAAEKVVEMQTLAAKSREKPDAMSAKVDALSAKITAIESERDELKRAELMRQAAAEGKIIPLFAETLKVTPLNVLEDIVKQAKPGAVPTGAFKQTAEKGVKVDALSAESLATFERFGITRDELEKADKAAA